MPAFGVYIFSMQVLALLNLSIIVPIPGTGYLTRLSGLTVINDNRGQICRFIDAVN